MSKGKDFGAALRKAAPPGAAPAVRPEGVDRFAAAERVLQGGALVQRPGLPVEEELGQGLATHAALPPVAEAGSVVEVEIDIDLLDDNPHGAREIYPEELIKARADEIQRDGQLEAAKVTPNPEKPGRYIVIDGGCRKRARQLLQHRKLRCVVMPMQVTAIELYRLSRVLNKGRDGGADLDDALAWSRLLAAGAVATQDELALHIGVKKSLLVKTLAFMKLPPAVLDRVREQPAPVKTAYAYELHLLWQEIKERPEAEQILLDLVARIQAGELRRADLEVIRERHTAPAAARKPREVSRQYRLAAGEGADVRSIGVLKEWDSGRLLLDVQVTSHAERERLVELIKRELAATAAAAAAAG